MIISLPPQTPFPAKVKAVHISKGQRISKHDLLLTYTYTEEKSELIGTFESPIDGVVDEICVVQDDELSLNTPVVKVLEECTHAIQYGGLCALCGKNMDQETDYNYVEDRAPIAMSHGTSDLKVSKDEAVRVESKWQKGLMESKKLILVVDLDQTVIHATVDPTIGEWMKDESNPNYPSLQNVMKFELEEKSYASPVTYLRTYYVKLRPGLEAFLEKVSLKYELHIYTMGTRSYAKAIAQCIDPEGKYFADRILSRDESGSMTQKSLERLFPTDTSMVVIIDDRGDVWNWSDHLVKVVPFDFFVGIGDINSNFLPKMKSLLGPSKRRESIAYLEEKLIEEKTESSEDKDKEERPLAKLQKNLDELASHSERLLYDDDDELASLEKALETIHHEFYTMDNPNVKDILPKMKQKVFDGLHFVFSGLLPLNFNIDHESIVVWVRSFGAVVDTEVTMQTTHIIAKNPYTYKAKLGKTMVPGCKIMHPDWLFDSMTNWSLCDTDKYEVPFDNEKLLPEYEVKKYMEKFDDLLNGDMDWLNDEEELSSDEEDLKRSLSDDNDDDDEDEGDVKRRKLEEDEEDEDEEDDDDDDEFAAELMLDLED